VQNCQGKCVQLSSHPAARFSAVLRWGALRRVVNLKPLLQFRNTRAGSHSKKQKPRPSVLDRAPMLKVEWEGGWEIRRVVTPGARGPTADGIAGEKVKRRIAARGVGPAGGG